MKPNRRRIKRSADPIRHLQSREGLAKAWSDIAREIYSPRVCAEMPPFVEKVAKSFWTVDPSTVVSAITNGDPAFFAAFQLRLDQIDCALVKEGRGIAERAPVIRAKFVLDGFCQTAIDVLVENGGEWPPSDPSADEPPA